MAPEDLYPRAVVDAIRMNGLAPNESFGDDHVVVHVSICHNR